MLHQLPTEIALQIISSLSLSSLSSTALVSREWNALIKANESTVYRSAALLHRFIDEDQLSSGVDATITDWKAHCRRQLEIERGWRGKGPSVTRELKATGLGVHRIKADYEFDFVIGTCQRGGLFVCDIGADHILWALPASHVDIYVHVEYDRGYMVFNRYDNCKEVWRHTFDTDGEHSETSPPDKKMLDISTQAAAWFNPSSSRRGHFTAWALLRMPEDCRLFRVSYPNMLAVATDNAYAFDLQTMKMTTIIRDLQQRHQGLRLGATRYAEVNDLYAFICGEGGLRIFSKKCGALLYQLRSKGFSGPSWDVRPQSIRSSTASVVHPQTLRYNKQSSSSSHGTFMACHVSSSGKDLAILTDSSRMILLPDFQRLSTGSKTVRPQDIAIILNFRPSTFDEYTSFYLAVGSRNGKFAVALQNGIYVISPDFDFTRLTAARPPRPGVFVCRLPQFESQSLSFLCCLQITHDAVYVTYKPSESGIPGDLKTVYIVRF